MDLSPIRLIDVADASATIIKQLQGARSVTAKVVDTAIMTAAREAIENTLAAELSAELEGVLDMHGIINGDRAGNGSDPDDWDSGLDDAVAELFKATLEPFMGPGFVGEHSVDTRIHEPGELETFARKVAKGVAERMTTDKDMAATIAGLFDKDELTKEGKNKPKDDGFKAVVVIVLADYLGKNGEAGVLDLLDLASDDDEILAAGPLETLAGSYVNKEEIARCMRVWRAQSAGWRDEAISAAKTANTPPTAVSVLPAVGKPEAAMSMTGEPVEKPKKTRKKKGEVVITGQSDVTTSESNLVEDDISDLIGELPTSAVVSPAPVSVMPAERVTTENGDLVALRLLKEHGRTPEADLAAALGISRSGINNMVREKVPCALEPHQRAALAEQIDVHLRGLAQARAALGQV